MEEDAPWFISISSGENEVLVRARVMLTATSAQTRFILETQPLQPLGPPEFVQVAGSGEEVVGDRSDEDKGDE